MTFGSLTPQKPYEQGSASLEGRAHSLGLLIRTGSDPISRLAPETLVPKTLIRHKTTCLLEECAGQPFPKTPWPVKEGPGHVTRFGLPRVYGV